MQDDAGTTKIILQLKVIEFLRNIYVYMYYFLISMLLIIIIVNFYLIQ